MPTKARSARATRAQKAPDLEDVHRLRDLAFDAPVNKWHLDKQVRELLDLGLAGSLAAAPRPYWSARHRAVGVVRMAMIGAIVRYHLRNERENDEKELRALQKLSAELDNFIGKARQREAVFQRYLPAKAIQKIPEVRAARRAEPFRSELSALIRSQSELLPARGDARDHFANLFIDGMLRFWHSLTKSRAPRPLLVRLIAATCRDTGILLDHDREGLLEDWLAQKLKGQIRPSLD